MKAPEKALPIVAATGNYTFVSDSCTLVWTGKKAIGSHTGNIKITAGNIKLDSNMISGEFVIDMKSITCTDITDSSNNKDFVGHMMADDFFGVAANPTAKISLKKIAALDDKSNYLITADLTIKGITNEITFPAHIVTEAGRMSVSADIVVDRTRWGIIYNSPTAGALGDKFIYDNFNLAINLKGKKD
ncbi:MAG: YceI family protein [Bacteroidota bacterium]